MEIPMRNGTRTLLFIAACLFGTQIQAIQINSTGQNWTVDWSISINTTGTLSVTSSWYVSSFSTSQIVLDIDITNTTSLTGQLTNADITSFGFGVTPNATGSFLTSGTVFDGMGSGSGPQQTVPGGFKRIDICIFTSGCSGGSVNDALPAGDSDYLQMLLTGDFSKGFVNLTAFPVKFQTNLGSFHAGGCINRDPDCMPAPEPSVSPLLALGLLLMGLGRFSARPRFDATRRH
jgi:hypothetical protein